MSKMSLSRKALLVIEALCLYQYDIIRERSESEELADLKEFLDNVYKISHIGVSPSCKDSHKDWEEELQKLYDGFKGHYI